MIDTAVDWQTAVRECKLKTQFKTLLNNLIYAAKNNGALDPSAVCYILIGDKRLINSGYEKGLSVIFDEYAGHVNGVTIKLENEELKDDENGMA